MACTLLLHAMATLATALPQDFVLYNTLEDGELETRIRVGNITAKEVTVGRGLGLKFRQLSDGTDFIQLIYDEDNKISDCEYLHDNFSVSGFLNTFAKDVQQLTLVYNATMLSLSNGVMPQSMKRWMNYKDLLYQCKQTHREIKRMLKNKDSSKNKSRSRNRRDLEDFLRIPGTKWCGKGRSAMKYTDVGLFSSTDKCCRKHDSACPFWISGFDTKYGLFNWRVNTIMHCYCDERFRSCLKRVGTSDANLVGKLFFNVVQTKCFIFKKKKTCVDRSWWGKCQKKKYIKQAILRDNMSY